MMSNKEVRATEDGRPYNLVGVGFHPRPFSLYFVLLFFLSLFCFYVRAEEETEQPSSQEALISFNFKKATTRYVVDYLTKSQGLTVIEEVPLTGEVTIVNMEKVTLDEALNILNSFLKGQGATLIRDGKVVRVVPLAEVKQRPVPVGVGSEPESVSPVDEVITQVVPLRYADASAVQENLKTLVAPYGDISANVRSNTLIITETASNIHRLLNIIKELDNQIATVANIRVFVLINADATEVARLIQGLFVPAVTPSQRRARERMREQRIRFFRERRQGGQPTSAPPPSSAEGSLREEVKVAADVRTNSVIVMASVENLQLIEELVRRLDAEPEPSLIEIKIFALVNADAQQLAKTLSQLFPAARQTRSTQQSTARRGQRAVEFGRSKATVEEEIQITVDARTNSLIVAASHENLAIIEGIIKELDADTSAQEAIFVIRLNNADASNLEAVLNALLGGKVSRGVGTVKKKQATKSIQRSGTSTKTPSSNGSRSEAPAAFQQASYEFEEGLAQEVPPEEEEEELLPEIAERLTGLVGQVRIVAEPDRNALVITTSPRNLELLQKIIADLDQPPPQVLIQVLIAEITLDETTELGLEWSLFDTENRGGVEFGISGFTTGLTYTVLAKHVDAFLRAYQEQGKLNVLSRPQILVSDNQTASITVANRVPLIRSTRITEQNTIINTIAYEDIGILLSVTPQINPQGLVNMEVTPEISTLTGETIPISVSPTGAILSTAPVFATRSATTKIAVNDGQTIVIGGLLTNNLTQRVKKVPILGDIPLLGLLFQSRIDVNEKTELLVFLTPQVAFRTEQLDEITSEEKDRAPSLKEIDPARWPEAKTENLKSKNP